MTPNTPSVERSCKKRMYSTKPSTMPKPLSIIYRYIITDYEHLTFSVHQAKFEGDLSEQIVPISLVNATTEPKHSNRISRGTVVGASVGAATSFLILIVILFFTLRKWRSRVSERNKVNSLASLDPPNVLSSDTIYEIDNNSLFWGYREIPDTGTGRPELLDRNLPSGSGRVIQEMPPHPPVELMRSQRSIETSMVQNAKTLNKFATSVSKGRSKEDRTSCDESKGLGRTSLPTLPACQQPSIQRRSSY